MDRKKLIIGIILVIGVLFGFLVYKNYGKKITPPSEKPQEYIPTAEDVKKILLNEAKLSFPQITSREVVLSSSQLPKELVPFIKTEAQDPKFQKVSYSDGKRGFFIEYKLTGVALEKIHREFRDIAISHGWQSLYGSRTNLFAFRELENSIYKLRISQSLNEDKPITVTIEVMIK